GDGGLGRPGRQPGQGDDAQTLADHGSSLGYAFPQGRAWREGGGVRKVKLARRRRPRAARSSSPRGPSDWRTPHHAPVRADDPDVDSTAIPAPLRSFPPYRVPNGDGAE